MNKLMLGVGAAILVPFGIAGATRGPSGPWGHAGFHIGYITTTVAALVLIWQLRRHSQSRTVRGLSVALFCAQTLFLAGQVTELAVVESHKGPQAGADALLDPAHETALLLTGPGLLATGILLIVLAVSVVLAARNTRGKAPTASTPAKASPLT